MRSKPLQGWWSHTNESDYQMFKQYGLPYLPGAWRATFHLDENCSELVAAPFSRPTTFPGTAKTCESCGHLQRSDDLGRPRIKTLQQVVGS
jgi:hypothetical protein